MRRTRKSRKRYNAVILVLLGILTVLCIAIIFLSMAYFSQMRLNQFSKNIIFSDNYFLRNYAYTGEDDTSDYIKEYYTFNEAVEVVTSLIERYGIEYDQYDMEIFHRYHPDRELTDTDIFGYYYNVVRSISETYDGIGYFLFTEHIEKIIGMSSENDDYTYPREVVLAQNRKESKPHHHRS